MVVELIAITPDAEAVIERAARTCCQSDDKIALGSAGKLIGRLLKLGHSSPLEHAYATFRIEGCSRAMTHQLVRHRLLAVSQQSQRYVSEQHFDYVVPPTIPAYQRDEYHADMATIQAMYRKWRGRSIPNEDARFVLPNACVSEIVISAHFREFRHVFQVRCDRTAQWEIRDCARQMLAILLKQAPHAFEDLADLVTDV